MNYATVAPIVRALQRDARLEIYFTASEDPGRRREIYAEATPPFRLISPLLAAFIRFDAYLAADFLWVNLLRGARRVQTFHGVAGKYRTVYDSPSRSMREWDRLFFINRRRYEHFITSGAIDAEGQSARLIGMPKLDCLVDGSLQRDDVLRSLGIDPESRTVMYAPTWSPYSSLTSLGEELIKGLSDAGYTVIVKLHDRSHDPRYIHSGGHDWGKRLAPLLAAGRGLLAGSSDSSRYLAAADVLITDHSSVGFEYLLLDRPLVRIHLPELIAHTDIEPSYVEMLSSAARSALHVGEVLRAVDQSFADPRQLSENRRQVAAEMFYRPGTATSRAVAEMYELLELNGPAVENENPGTSRVSIIK
jgi:CDP-glycerol glycerophosphotransferase (TagB/SpsB family)